MAGGPVRPAALAVCGLGPAGSGLLVAAAREGRLDRLLDGGVVALDPRGAADLAGGLGRYRITANSLGKVFLECLDSPAGDTLLAGLSRSPEAAALRAYAQTYPPLPVIGPFVAKVAERVARTLAAHPACRLLTGVGVDAVDVGPGGITVRDSTRSRHRVRSAVLTLGGLERADTGDGLLRAATRSGLVGRVLPGNAVISDLDTVAGAPEVTVLGGSHSGWAVAARLVAATGCRVTLVQRRPPPIYYASAAEAAGDGYRFHPVHDVCPLSGRVHRFGGLRGPARELALRATRGGAARLRLVTDAGPWTPDRLAGLGVLPAPVVVACLGYGPRLPALSRSGAALRLRTAGGALDTGTDGLVRDVAGAVVPGLFAFGLGAGLRPSPEVGGEPSYQGRLDGVWIYQYDAGGRVLRSVLDHLAASESAADPLGARGS
jgi:hypothetical protein